MRRQQTASDEPAVRVGELVLDRTRRQAALGESSLSLSRKEFDLLLLLAERQGEVVSKREMLAEVWRQPYGGSERTVDVHLSALRTKLGESSRQPRYLITVHRVGVKLVDPSK